MRTVRCHTHGAWRGLGAYSRKRRRMTGAELSRRYGWAMSKTIDPHMRRRGASVAAAEQALHGKPDPWRAIRHGQAEGIRTTVPAATRWFLSLRRSR